MTRLPMTWEPGLFPGGTLHTMSSFGPADVTHAPIPMFFEDIPPQEPRNLSTKEAERIERFLLTGR